MLYFAYGSNMLNRRLQLRVPSADVISPARLAGYQLRFHKRSNTDGSGKCSLADKKGSIAYGVVFKIDPAEKKYLDRVEGLGNGYRDLRVTLSPESFSPGGELTHNKHSLMTAFTYLATESHIDESLKPFKWYKQLVLKGAELHFLPEKYVNKIRQTEAVTDPDKQRRKTALDIIRQS